VVATSLVLVAVFVPVALFPGTTGILFRQFALTIAFSVSISAFQRTNPDSCAIGHFPGEHRERAKGRFFRWFNDGFNAGAGFYQSTVRRLWTGGWRRCCSFLPCLAAPTGSISAFRAPSSRRTIKAT